MKVSEIMSKNVLVCRPEDNLYDVAALMWDNDIGVMPVVNDQSQAIGMITDRDICMSAFTKGKTLQEIYVHTAMSRQLFSCSPGDKVEDAEATMMLYKIRRMPVIDEAGRPSGILTLNDIARHSGDKKSKELEPDQFVQVMNAVCEPRPKLWQPHSDHQVARI